MLAVKDNQEHLHDDIKEAFEQDKSIQINCQINMGHGRIEKRICCIIKDTDWICSKEQWEGLKTLNIGKQGYLKKALL